MELNSLVSMFDELEVDDCLSIEGGSQNVAGVVVGIITVGVIGVFIVCFYCPFCDSFFDAADAIGYTGDPEQTAYCPTCGGELEPVYEEDENTGC